MPKFPDENLRRGIFSYFLSTKSALPIRKSRVQCLKSHLPFPKSPPFGAAPYFFGKSVSHQVASPCRYLANQAKIAFCQANLFEKSVMT